MSLQQSIWHGGHRLISRAVALVVLSLLLAVIPLFASEPRAGLTPSGCVWNGYAAYFNTYSYPAWLNFCYLGTNGTTYDNAGDYVVGVQRQLNKMGYTPLANDGLYGSQTETKVRTFQQVHGLTVDGVVGYLTWDEFAYFLDYSYTASGYDYHHVRTVAGDYWRRNNSTLRWGIRNKDYAYWTSFTTDGPS